mgnify:CR=1 FL=1
MKGERTIHRRVLEYAYMDTDALYRDFHIPEQGYDEEQAEESRQRYGSNVLSGRASDTVLYRLRRAFINPFAVILFVLASISFVTDVLLASNFSRDMTTVIIILSMLLISGGVRFIQEMRAKRVADRLTEMIASEVLAYRYGQWVGLSSTELVVGDTVRLLAGDRVPADIRLTAAKDLFVSQSVITGESAIWEKQAQVLPEGQARSYGEYENIVFMGSSVIGGTGEGIVLAVGKDTVYGGFSDAEAHLKNGFDQGANSIAWVLIRFMTTLVPVVFVISALTRGDWGTSFLFALSVAVGLTPEMLPVVINACLARGERRHGAEADHCQEHQRHAELWQHGCAVRGQDGNHHGERHEGAGREGDCGVRSGIHAALGGADRRFRRGHEQRQCHDGGGQGGVYQDFRSQGGVGDRIFLGNQVQQRYL